MSHILPEVCEKVDEKFQSRRSEFWPRFERVPPKYKKKGSVILCVEIQQNGKWNVTHLLYVEIAEFYSNVDFREEWCWGAKTDLERIISKTRITGRERKDTTQNNSKPTQWGESKSLSNICSVSTYLLTYLLTYSMVQSPSWEANWFAASQEIPRISRNPKVHYRNHKRPPTVSNLGQPIPVHISTSHLLEIHPNIIQPSRPRSPQWSPSLRFPHQDPIQPPLPTHKRHMPSPSHSSRFYHPRNIHLLESRFSWYHKKNIDTLCGLSAEIVNIRADGTYCYERTSGV